MNATTGWWRAQASAERGAMSLMVIVLFVALAALAGIVVDGGAKLTADENVAAAAQEAARAGATTVDVSSAYATGSFAVDQQRAIAAATAYWLGLATTSFRSLRVAAGLFASLSPSPSPRDSCRCWACAPSPVPQPRPPYW